MKKIFIIKAGSTFENVSRLLGDMDDWISKGLGCQGECVSVVDVRYGGKLPEPDRCSGVVISGSRAHVTEDLGWLDGLVSWTRSIMRAGIPLLGICFGHQLIAHAMGGKVGFHPQGREIGTVGIELDGGVKDDVLFGQFSQCFAANVSHKQTVFELPEGAVRLAFNAHEPNHAFRLGGCAWGVQFHPEFSAEAMNSMIREQAGDLKAEGFDVGALLGGVRETPEAHALLGRFYGHIQEKI